MNNFWLILHLLFIFFIVQLKCSKDDYSKIEYDGFSFNTIYKKDEFYEKYYFENIKYLENGQKIEKFRNIPRFNVNENATFMIFNGDDFEAWPNDTFNTNNDNNIDCEKFTSIIAFEFDNEKKIYLLDEGMGLCPIKLYIFYPNKTFKTSYEILDTSYSNHMNLTDLVIDIKNNYIYIAYYDNSTKNSEMGLLVFNLNNNKTNTVKFNNTQFKLDEQYLLKNEFMVENFPNITKNLISVTLSCDNDVLFFCPLLTRKIYSIKTKTIIGKGDSYINEANEGYKNDATSSIIAGNLGNLYFTGVEKDVIYIAGQIDNDLSIFEYKGIDNRNISNEGEWNSKLSIMNGTLYIVSKNITKNSENITITTKVYKLSIDKESSYISKCAGLNYKWKKESYIIWVIFIIIIIFVLIFVFVGNKQDKDINKKND